MSPLSRRSFIRLAGTAAAATTLPDLAFAAGGTNPLQEPVLPEFRIRTITAGVELADSTDTDAIHEALQFLDSARSAASETYEVQTIRIATQPFGEYVPAWNRPSAIQVIESLDRIAASGDIMFNIGPVLTGNEAAPDFGRWAADVITATTNTSFSAFMASEEGGVHENTIRASAEAIAAIGQATDGGEGNFRFCTTSFCPPGTPFFPAAWHRGEHSFALGLESPNLLMAALSAMTDGADPVAAMTSRLNRALEPVHELGGRIARES